MTNLQHTRDPNNARTLVADGIFELLGKETEDTPFWSEILSTPISLRRLSEQTEQLSSFSERVENRDYITLQTSRALPPDDLVMRGNEYIDTQNFRAAQQTLYIKWGSFKSGLNFFTGYISEAGSFYVTGASSDGTQATPSVLNFEFYAEADKNAEIHALKRGAANLRAEFAARGVPGALAFLARFKASHPPASGLLSLHPQLKLRIADIEERDELNPDEAYQETDLSPSSTSLNIVTPKVRRLIHQLSELSKVAFSNANVLASSVFDNELRNYTEQKAPLANLEPGMLASTTPELLTNRAHVRFSTPTQRWPSMAIFLKVPTRPSRHRDDLKDAKILLAGPSNWFGLREIYSINGATDLINNRSKMIELFEALHTINLGAHRDDPTQLSSLLYVASSLGVTCTPASALARIVRRHRWV